MRSSLALVALAAAANAQSTYTTTNDGTLNLVAGLTTITEYSGANPNATAEHLALITDSNWSSTGVYNIGFGWIPAVNSGTFAGNFGGGTYFDASHSIIMIGQSAESGGVQYWGEWNVQLLLSNGTYSNATHFTSFDVVGNSASVFASTVQFYNVGNNNVQTNQFVEPISTAYLRLNISDFDPTNIGVTGIKLSGFSVNSYGLDLTYIGVVGPASPVPEPSTYGLALGGLALAVVAARRRSKK